MESSIKLRNIMVAVFGVIIVIGVVVFGLSRSGQLSGSVGGPFSLVVDFPEILQSFGSDKDTRIYVVDDDHREQERSEPAETLEDEFVEGQQEVEKVDKVFIYPEDL